MAIAKLDGNSNQSCCCQGIIGRISGKGTPSTSQFTQDQEFKAKGKQRTISKKRKESSSIRWFTPKP
jgi:hypothetical protein